MDMLKKIPYTSDAIRLSGRWSREENQAITTTTGSVIELAFRGERALFRFDTSYNVQPNPHLWISVDGSPRIEVPLDSFLQVNGYGSGNHVATVIFKSADENQHRWYPPLVGKLTFLGAEVEAEGILPLDERKTIEIVGDSITEGVLTERGDYEVYPIGSNNRVYQDDVCATYGWLTAEKLNLRPIIMGYGAVGIHKSGSGSVPKVIESYPYNFHGSPVTRPSADFILINHGANDARCTPEEYLTGYERFLDRVIEMNPSSQIIVMCAFCGAFAEELGTMVQMYNQANGTDILYVNSKGWIPEEQPLHPWRSGHQIVADKLSAILKEQFDL